MKMTPLKIFVVLLAMFTLIGNKSGYAAVGMSAANSFRNDIAVGNNVNHSHKNQKNKIKNTKKVNNKNYDNKIYHVKKNKNKNQTYNNSINTQNNDKYRKTEQQNSKVYREKEKDINIPYVNVNKIYASKLFATISGYITIEEKNIPRRISITQESKIQINLQTQENCLWYLNFDENILRIAKDKIEGDKKIIVFEPVKAGNTRIEMDYMDTSDDEYKILKSKSMLVMVEE